MTMGLDLEAQAKEAAANQPVSFVGPPANIMTIEALVAYGFREWPVAQHDKHDRHWQFCKRDEKGKKLFVTIRLWEFSKYSSPERGQVQNSFDADCQLDMNGPKTFNVNISVNDMTPHQVVEWFENMFDRMGCTYYELYHHELYDDEGKQTHYNCQSCGRYLPPPEAVEPYLCQTCSYQHDSGGLKPVAQKRRIKRRR